MSPSLTLKASVGTVVFDSPLLLASGYITETPTFFRKAERFGCSGMVTRSLKKEVPPERKRVPAPRYAVFNEGTSMLNCEWGNEHPWHHWKNDWADAVHATRKPLIISLSGRDVEGCRNLIGEFNEKADAFEINVSCSHSGALHGNLNLDFVHLKELFSKIRPLTDKPIWLKLAYSPFVVQMAKEGESLGADAIVCTNTIGPGLIIDIETGFPKVGIQGGAGGVSGPGIFPIALRSVYEISTAVKIPVVGVGGISSADDVIQMMMAGASAVQLYTLPALRGPNVFRKLTEDLKAFLAAHPRFKSLSNIVGLSHGKASAHHFSAPAPRVIEEQCVGCGDCVTSCAFDSIKLSKVVKGYEGKKIAIINDSCIGCNACVGVCPTEYSAIVTTYHR